MWATEAEAAELSGVGLSTFRTKVAAWEKRGFPKVNPENGKRSIPQILAFWKLPQNHSVQAEAPPEPGDESTLEKWDDRSAA